MKAYKFLSILIVLVITTFVITSCVEDDDYIIPNLNGTSNSLNAVLKNIEKGALTEISITELKETFFTSREATKVDQNYVVKGYVTSSDESGNFYKEFYMQDAPENPTAGIKVVLELRNSYNNYNIGREVYIQLKGLYIGETRAGDQDATIGGFVKSDGTELEPISKKQYTKLHHILRSNTTKKIVPLPITFSKISDANLGMYVKIDDAYFEESERGKTYFDSKRDFDTERKLVACEGTKKGEFTLETSSFANFGSSRIPSGGGSISGIVTKDYNRNLRLAINSTDDVKFTKEICKLEEIIPVSVTTLNETFDSVDKNKDIILEGWHIQKPKGDRNWIGQERSRNKFAQISGYKAKQYEIEAWLVTPGLNLTKATNKNFSFESKAGHSRGERLEVFISSDFDSKDVTKATWKALKVKLADKKPSGYSKVINSGDIDLSSYSGIVHIAFKYKGNNSDKSGTWQIDNVKFNYGNAVTTVKKSVASLRALFSSSKTTITEDAKIKAIVTSDATTKNLDAKNAFIQDATAGIALRFDSAHNLKQGEEIEISVKDLKLSQYKGLLQLNLTNASITSQKASSLPTPKTITITEALTDKYESQLVKIEDVQFKDNTKTYNDSNLLTNCTNELTLYVRSDATFASQQVANKKGTITGILSDSNGVQLYIAKTTDINFTQSYTSCSSGGGSTTTVEKSVASLRALFSGSETTITEDAKIKAIVTSDTTTKNLDAKNAFIQDATAGIALRFDSAHNLKQGEEIEISVKDLKLSQYKGLLQLNLTNASITSQKANSLPTPKTITITEALTDKYESQLVKIEDVQFKDNSKTYSGSNLLTNCTNELTLYVRNEATFASQQVANKKGTITGILSDSNGAQLYIAKTSDINFTQSYTSCSSGGGNTGGATSSGKFDFENLTTSSTSYSGIGTLTGTDGASLEYQARTNLGSYTINNRGLMMKNAGHIKITFPNGIKQVKFKYRGAFTSSSDRVVIVNEGDENSTTELKKVTFPYNTTSETLTLDLNKTGSYTITIKGGTSKQIVIDDIEWTK